MGKTVLTLLILLPWMVFGKETIKITRERESSSLKEVFYVLKSDSSVKHGNYKILYHKLMMVRGYYKMGLKDSCWIEKNQQGKIRSLGWYQKGKRVGIWEFFDNNGKLEQKIDFSNNKVLFYQSSLADQLFKIDTGREMMICKLSQPPLFIGGISRFKEYVSKQLNPHPLHKPDEIVTGYVFIAFNIDTLGKVNNPHIIRGPGRACNAEALRVFSTIPEEWLPGILNGKSVNAEYWTTFEFNKEANKSKSPKIIENYAPNWVVYDDENPALQFFPGRSVYNGF